ncbi:MAG: helix-turn-helix domain-containing protein, partial [Cetobacterium sp.]
MEISEKIKLLRKDRGLSIKELSEKTGLSVGFISNLERDINSPSIAN